MFPEAASVEGLKRQAPRVDARMALHAAFLMAVAFELAGDAPRDRTPPHVVLHHEYFEATGGMA